MKYYIIAGERSGDLHGANLIKELMLIDPESEIRCWGGDMMRDAGGELVTHYRETAFMGFLEVVRNLRKIKAFMHKCRADIVDWQPDVVILIDYPGFNLRIAEFSKKKGFKTCYYISPKIWAWNQKRAFKIRRFVDRMFCILPFEKDFYKKFNYEVEYVGNPLTDSIKNYHYDETLINRFSENGKVNIAVLPGSRYQEVTNMLQTISQIFVRHPDTVFHLAGVDNLPQNLYADVAKLSNVELHINKAYDILKFADGAIVTSGTATLETALFDVPQVVCYRTSALTYHFAKFLIKIKFISLVNLVADRKVVDELIQVDFNIENLNKFITDIKQDSARINKIREGYRDIKKILGNHNTSHLTASMIYEFTGTGS